MASRLSVYADLLVAVRQNATDRIIHQAQAFHFPFLNTHQNPLLSKLAYLKLSEFSINTHEAESLRHNSLESLSLKQKLLRIRKVDDLHFEIVEIRILNYGRDIAEIQLRYTCYMFLNHGFNVTEI